MNNDRADQDSLRTFQLMSELEEGGVVSQRELANRLGIAVGLVNSYLKNFVAKGWVRIKNYPRNRYAYLLTPQGISEKSRLAYRHFSYFNNLYKVARQNYSLLFSGLAADSVQNVAFCGVDEVAEIAFLSLSETPLRLGAVFDDVKVGEIFFGHSIMSLDALRDWQGGPIVITVAKRRELLVAKVRDLNNSLQVLCPGHD